MLNVPRKPVALIILDGYGSSPERENNGIALANKPNFDRYFSQYPHITIQASGRAVGLPAGQMGNSEVGHITIGCGAILRQDLVRIDDAIADGSFFTNPVLLAAIAKAVSVNRPVHLVGLCSDGGVHSHVNHLAALIDLCKKGGAIPSLHLIADGRDTAPKSVLNYLPDIEDHLHKAHGTISTVSGRYYAMDRDKRWERTILAWRAMCFGEGRTAVNARAAIEHAYMLGEHDEFIAPTVIENGEIIRENDTVIFFNFRNDRARQLTYILAGPEFLPFDRGDFTPHLVTCLTEYDPRLSLPIAFAHESPETTLSTVVSDAGINQFHCAETEKYAHVTFFLNGGNESTLPGEDRVMIPSPAVATYDLAPEMSAKDVADAVIDAVEKNRYGFIVVNFANGDMVGHTAVRDAVIKAVETLDREVSRAIEHAKNAGYSIILTADHGNCDQLVDPETGQPHTQHTTNPVPFLLIDDEQWHLNGDNGGLSNIAPTVLQLMGLPKPPGMTAKSLLQRD